MYLNIQCIPSQKSLNLAFCLPIRPNDQIFNNVIRTGIDPIRARKYSQLSIQITHIINYTPRIVNLRITKCIAIIPFLHCRKAALHTIILHHLQHL